MKRMYIFILIFIFAFSFAFAEKKAPIQYDPANYPTPERQGGNTVATATVISSLPYNNVGTTSGYNNNYDEVCPYSGSTSPDVVYSFSPTNNITNGLISLCGNTYYDSKLYIYENTVTPSAPYACNDDFCTSAVGQSYVSELSGLNFTAGNTYYIVVDGYGGDSGTYELDFTGDIANDNCATATAIGEVIDLPFNTALATASMFGGYITSKDLWYEFTAPGNGSAYFGVCDSGFDTYIALWGECDPATLIAENDDSCGLQSELFNIPVVSGEDYYLQIGGYSSSNGPGVLDVVFTLDPPIIAVNPTSMDEYLNIGETATQVLNIANSGSGDLTFNLSHDYISDTESSAPRKYGDYADRSRISSSEIDLSNRMITSRQNNLRDNRAAGDVLATYTGMPSANTGMVWVGDLLYVINYDYYTLDVYDISTQSVIASTPIHSNCYGITWDGMYLWIGDGAGNVYAYNLDGSSAGFSFTSPEPGIFPVITWDGSYFIIAPAWTMTNIYRVDETGAIIDVYINNVLPADEICWAPEHIGGHIWATTEYLDIRQINLNDGTGEAEVITQFAWPTFDNMAYAIDHHNDNLWWSDWEGPLYEIDDGILEGWLSYDTYSGTLAPGTNIDVTVTFDATDIYGGTYLAELAVGSNDPVTPQVIVPIMLDVTGEPDIVVDVTSIDFGSIPYGDSAQEYFIVSNIGTDWLDISDISCDNSDFTVALPEAEDITISVTVDYYYYEATWNIWNYATSAYYFASNQGFSASYENQIVTLSLEPGLHSIHCWDTYGDGGIAGNVTDSQGNYLAMWDYYDYSTYGEFDFGVDGLSDIALSLYVMEEQLIWAIFTPSNAGTITGDLTIYSNDPDTPEAVIALSGVCTAAQIVVNPTSMTEALFVDEIATQILTIENTGDEVLMFEISEQNVQTDRANSYYDELVKKNRSYVANRSNYISTSNSLARTSEGLKLSENPALDNSRTGSILNEWAPAGGVLPWGINWTDEPIIWLTDPWSGGPTIFGHDPIDGSAVRNVPAPWMGSFIGDMAFDWNHNLNWAVNVGGDNNIYGLDPITGDVLATLGGDFTFNSARGVAYDNNTDTFWIGSWNYSEIYHVAGLDWAIPGETIETIPFSGVAGLAFHENANVLAVIPNADPEYIYLLDAATGTLLDQYDPPANAPYGGAGIEFDGSGELWVARQNTGMVYQVEFSDLLGPRGVGDVSWLSEDITSGVLMPTESIDITVTFDATDMYGGTYQAELVINNNDPDNLDLVVPVTLDVTGIPNIAVDPVIINYGAHYVGATIEEILIISSTGTDDLEITDITSDNPDFYCDVTTYTISPGNSEDVIVNFNPSTVGIITGILTVHSNDPNDPEVYIDLEGEGLDAPEIVITPASFDINIAPDVIVDNTLTIENTGVVDVTYDISIEYMIPTDRVRNYGDYADRSRENASDIDLSNRMITSRHNNLSDNRAAGDVLATYTGMPPANTGMVWVGDLLYVIDYDYSTLDVYDISTQSVVAAYPIHFNAYGITWDGIYLWIGEGAGNVYAYNLDGSSAGFSFSIPEPNFPCITWDGSYFIVAAAWTMTNIFRVDETGAVINTYTNAVAPIDEICWVPEHTTGHIWATTELPNIMQINLNDGTGEAEIVSQFDVPTFDMWPYAIDHHNFNLWWSDWNGPLNEIDDGIVEFGWLSVDITSGTLSTGQSDDITLTVDANEVDSLGVYEASLVIVSNDPDDPVVYVPVTLTVNYPPEIVLPDDFTFEEDNSLVVDFDTYITDPNSSPYELSVAGNTNVTVDIVGSEVTFGAAPDWYGTETLTFTVDDGQTDSDVVDIIVTPVNDDPTIVLPDDFTFDEDEELVVDFSVFIDDVDPDDLTLSVTGNVEVTVDIDVFEVTFGATENWNGSETLTFIVDDNQGDRFSLTVGKKTTRGMESSNIDNNRATAEDDVEVIVTPVNDEPILIGFIPEDLEFTVIEDSSVTFSVEVEDIDSTIDYEWFVDDVLQTESTEEFVHIFEVVGDIEIKSVASDEEYEIETIWLVHVEPGSGAGNELLPVITVLSKNFPNPFNPTTTIKFDIKERETGKLSIYNMKGQLVFNKSFEAGHHNFLWDASSCSSGIYFYKLVTPSYFHTRKMILLK